jgi:predicted extracellular nuclease
VLLWILAGCFAAPISSEAQVVISQVYGGGGNTGALFHNDFVELFNGGTNTVDLAGSSVQYASAAGTTWQSAPLSGLLSPGHYFLLQLASGGVNGVPLPAPDATGSLNLSASGGKVALVATVSPLSGACPSFAEMLDLVGFGNSASCYEGTGPAPGAGNTLAIVRASGGCIDTDNNASDFFTSAPVPRNHNSPTNGCGSAPSVVALHAIQGSGMASPLAGQLITTTTNIVTGIRNNGFFIQSADAEADDDPQTSEAVFVSTPTALPAAVAIGNAVVVAGIVDEFKPASDPAVPPRTQIINAVVTLVDTAQPLPLPIILSDTNLSPDGAVDQLERFEGMRVRVDTFRVVGPTEGFIIESSAAGISDGVFYGVLGEAARPMREPGIPLLDPLPPDAPSQVPRFDVNPERLRVDSNAQPGAPRLEVVAGTVISNLVGVLDFEQRTWTLLPDAGGAAVLSSNAVAMPVPPAAANEFTVASFNLERFFDTTEDPSVDETVLTTNAFNGRLNKASLAIRNVLRAPDILGVVEIENLATLQALADRVNSDARSAGQSNVNYAAWLEEGNDIGGIDSGFLVNTARVVVIDVTPFGKDTTYTNPLTGQEETLNDRPPLVLRAVVPRPGLAEPLSVVVILNHLRSMLGIDDPTDGPRVRAKRRAQAEYLAGLVQERQTNGPAENLVLIGDFNAFPFNDGYVDVVGTIKGTPALSNEVTLASADLVEPDLLNLTDTLPATERYSFNFEGNAQAIDHILVAMPMRARVVRFRYARLGSDFPESFRSNFNRPERLSDHDATVAWFELVKQPRFTSIRLLDSGELELSWEAEPLQSVRIEASTDLVGWTTLDAVTADESGRGILTTTNLPASVSRFHRLASP